MIFLGASSQNAQTHRLANAAKGRPPKPKRESVRIVFDYNPNALDWNFENSEFAFVVISGDGNAQAVRYGPYNPAILGVYEGKLPEAAIVRLVDTARRIIPKASELAKPYVGSCDADSFQLSVSPPGSSVNPSKMSDFACLPAMSKDIRELVEEMRTVWKRLNRIPLAYGYLRSVQFFPLKSRELNLRWLSNRKLSHECHIIIRNASKHSPRLYAVTQLQYEQLLSLTRYPSHPFDFVVTNNRSAQSLTLFQSRK
jgi:hypothetical protein